MWLPPILCFTCMPLFRWKIERTDWYRTICMLERFFSVRKTILEWTIFEREHVRARNNASTQKYIILSVYREVSCLRTDIWRMMNITSGMNGTCCQTARAGHRSKCSRLPNSGQTRKTFSPQSIPSSIGNRYTFVFMIEGETRGRRWYRSEEKRAHR